MRIDVHQHMIPAAFRQLIERRGITVNSWPDPSWSVPDALAMMDQRSIATAVLSLSAPFVHAVSGTEHAPELMRTINEHGAELVKDSPDRFGLFASLPLPDVEGAVTEAVYALDELHADGIHLLSNARGRYLGDKEFEPLWAELNARSAVVFVHPNDPELAPIPGQPGPLVDFPFDTTRTAVNMVLNGVMGRYPDVKVILPHAGGFLPYAAYRFLSLPAITPGLGPDDILADLRRFYFDTALSSTPTALPTLLSFAAEGHILYGSDSPFADAVKDIFDQGLDDYAHFESGQFDAINRGNAEALFPRLKS